MKIKMRKPVLFLLLVTVLAPIVLYTDTLSSYFTRPSSRTEFIEDLSTFTLGGDVRPLNLLPQESSTLLKEPPGDIYSENSSLSLSNTSDTLSSEDARKARQLTEESMKHQAATGNSNDGIEVAMNGNHISQVTDSLHEPHQMDKTSLELVSAGKSESRATETSSKKKTSPTDSSHTSDTTSAKIEIRQDQRTVQTSGRVVSGETARGKGEDQNAQVVPPDARVRQLKDQLIRGKVYLSLSATRNNPHFIRELRLRTAIKILKGFDLFIITGTVIQPLQLKHPTKVLTIFKENKRNKGKRRSKEEVPKYKEEDFKWRRMHKPKR